MVDKETVKLIEERSAFMRRDIIEMGFIAGGRGAHFGPALSCTEIVASLFFKVMNHDPKNPRWAGRDRFIQSKGHACLAYYSALIESGYLEKDARKTFKQDGSHLPGHPSRDMDHGIEISSGSLGNGFAIACGMAKAAKVKKEDQTYFCLVGDGECNEGLIWEAAMNAGKNKLDNMVAIVDRNGVQLAGKTSEIMDFDIAGAWKAFGWDVTVLKEGNDPEAIVTTLEDLRGKRNGKPQVIIAETIKGKGISFMEGSLNWHARVMNEAEYKQAVVDLEKA